MPTSFKNERDERLKESTTNSVIGGREFKTAEIKKSAIKTVTKSVKIKRSTAKAGVTDSESINIPEKLANNSISKDRRNIIKHMESSLEREASEQQVANMILEERLRSEVVVSEEEEEYTKKTQLENELNFFNTFGKVPNLDDVSLDPSDLESAVVTEMAIGSFAHPASGIQTPSLDSTETIQPLLNFDEAKQEEIVEDEAAALRLKYNETTEGKKEEEDANVHVDTRHSVPPIDETFKVFFETIKTKENTNTDAMESVKEFLQTEEKTPASKTAVMDFINELVEHSITDAEHLEREKILRNLLDKNKLINELKSKYDALEVQRRQSQFLDHRTVTFLKRKGTFRSISAEDDKSLSVHRENFYDTLKHLDECLNKEEKTKTFYANHMQDLKQQLAEAQQQSSAELNNLEHLMKITFQRKSFDKLLSLIKRYLKRMSSLRDEISQVRLRLILQQHQFSSLKTQMEELEDLGNGLKLQQFESLERETFAISKKIEEHNSALKRLHTHFNNDVHKMAHLNEKQKMIRSVTVAQKHYLEELQQGKMHIREHITRLKLQRNHYRHDILNLSRHSGLLSKPTLMRDYDRTLAAANTLRQTNGDLRSILQELNNKIILLQKNSSKIEHSI